ncbi:MAG: 50S ribosomal protein L29 [bacterium]
MKFAELRQKSKTELEKILKEYRDNLCQLYFNLVSGKVKNVKAVRQTKKNIARILTLLKDNK